MSPQTQDSVCLFVRFILSACLCVSMYGYVQMSAVLLEARDVRPPEAWVTGGWEPPNMDAGNRIQVFARAVPWSLAGQVVETRGGDLVEQNRPLRACFRSDAWFPVFCPLWVEESATSSCLTTSPEPTVSKTENRDSQTNSPCRWSSHLYSHTLCSHPSRFVGKKDYQS